MPFFAVLLVDVQGTFRLLTDEQYGGDLYLITTAKTPLCPRMERFPVGRLTWK